MTESADPEGLRVFYYLVQDLKALIFSLISLHFKVQVHAECLRGEHSELTFLAASDQASLIELPTMAMDMDSTEEHQAFCVEHEKVIPVDTR